MSYFGRKYLVGRRFLLYVRLALPSFCPWTSWTSLLQISRGVYSFHLRSLKRGVAGCSGRSAALSERPSKEFPDHDALFHHLSAQLGLGLSSRPSYFDLCRYFLFLFVAPLVRQYLRYPTGVNPPLTALGVLPMHLFTVLRHSSRWCGSLQRSRP